MEAKTELDFSFQKKNNITENLSIEEIIKIIKSKIENNNIECVIFSPKYREMAKNAYSKISSTNTDEIVFFGGSRSFYGYYKYSYNQIYLFEIYQNNILIDNVN